MQIKTYFIRRTMIMLIAAAAILVACKNGNQAKQDAPETKSETAAKKGFEKVVVPPHLQDPQAKVDFMVEHYWTNFNFADTTLIGMEEITEQAFADYVHILPYADRQKADASIKAMLDKSISSDESGKMYAYFLEQYKKYLHDPNSPMRNEELYITVGEYVVQAPVTGEADRERMRFDLELMKKNRMSTVATDIVYVKANGQKGNLHGLSKELTILYFYNPDCTACKETTEFLNSSEVVQYLLAANLLDILAFYPDEDTTAWHKHLNDMPRAWINGRDPDQTVKLKLLYDLKAIPCLYLLDNQKRVMMKDADVRDLESALISIASTEGALQENGPLR